MAKKKSFRSAPRIVSGRDSDRCTLLIRLVPPCVSPSDARDLVAGEKPRQEIHGGNGHADAEEDASKHTLRAAFTEGESESGHHDGNEEKPRAMVLVNAVWRTLTAFSQGEFPACAKVALARSRIMKIDSRLRMQGPVFRINSFFRMISSPKNSGSCLQVLATPMPRPAAR